MSARCTVCGCDDSRRGDAHAQATALAAGDLDRALDCGLLDATPCGGCSEACNRLRLTARDARLAALAARERYRARAARLERRAHARAAARAALPPALEPAMAAPTAAVASAPDAVPPDARPAPPLPSAIAAVLARAKQRAGSERP